MVKLIEKIIRLVVYLFVIYMMLSFVIDNQAMLLKIKHGIDTRIDKEISEYCAEVCDDTER